MMNIKQLVSFNSSFIVPHSSFPFPSFVRVNPQVPAPARGEPRLKRTREQRPQNGQPALVQKVYGELHAREILEQLARLAPRVDARQRVPRAVRVAAQELTRREILPGVLLQTRRVLAQTLHRLARQTVCKREARLRP